MKPPGRAAEGGFARPPLLISDRTTGRVWMLAAARERDAGSARLFAFLPEAVGCP